jgi:hypothetical protein
MMAAEGAHQLMIWIYPAAVATEQPYLGQSMEDPMLSKNKAKEMRRRASQRRATHKARRAALTLRAETRRAALTLRAETRMAAAAKAEKGKTKVGSKGHVKSTVKASKPKKK